MSEVQEEAKVVDLKAMLSTHQETERNGRVMEFAPGVSFTIARANTPEYQKELRAAYQPYEMLLRGSELDPKIDAKLNAQVIAKTILKGWSGVVFDGKELEFNYQNAVQILLDLPDLREWIWQQANNPVNYRKSRIDAAGKDSAG